ERILGTTVELVEVSTVAELIIAVGDLGVVAVALDAPQPGRLPEAVAAAGSLPVLRPLWRRQRNARGEIDEVSDATGSLRLRTSWASLTVSCRRSETHASLSPTVEQLFPVENFRSIHTERATRPELVVASRYKSWPGRQLLPGHPPESGP
ncbi:MAG: hypothetical protein LC749_18825, partial [Actinobacteria bacterium]|nr:hypothetical protein [Actinomycetota bacterium]